MATVRWGIAATGGIAATFAGDLTLVDGADLVAVGSRSLDRADEFGDRYSVPHRYGSYEELAADPSVDVVYVASPHVRHEADTLLFLEAGKHVLCEKPFALNQHQARRMVEAARARDLFLLEAMWSRFLPAYRTLVDLLAQSRIGTPLVVEADFGVQMPFPPEHRVFNLALGGGALLDLGIYPVQLCSLVFGPPDRVAALGQVGGTGADETVAAVLQHAGGGIGVVQAATRVDLACRGRISGSEGWIDLPPMMHHPHHLVVGGPAGAERLELGYEGVGLRFEAAEVGRCLAEGLLESPIMPLDETLAIAGTLDAIRQQIGVVYPGE